MSEQPQDLQGNNLLDYKPVIISDFSNEKAGENVLTVKNNRAIVEKFNPEHDPSQARLRFPERFAENDKAYQISKEIVAARVQKIQSENQGKF